MAKETDDYRGHDQSAANAPDGGRLFNVALGITPRRRPFLMVLALMAVASLVLPGCSNETAATDGQAAAAATQNAEAAPNFEIELLANASGERGDILELSELVGKPAVINFWYPSCPPCRREIPDLESTWKAHESDGVQFIGIMATILDTADEGQDFIAEFGITYPVGVDSGDVVVDYKIIGFPTTVFIDKDLNIVRKWTGALNAENLEEFVEELLH